METVKFKWTHQTKKKAMKSKFEVHRMEFNDTVYQNGFSMRFENGYTISVQFSKKNYSDGEKTAEVAAWDAEGNWIQFEDGRDVVGWQTTNDVAKLIDIVSKKA